MDAAGIAVALDSLPWETWDDPALAARSAVRWKLIFSGRRTRSEAMSCGLAEIAPGGELISHHHAPPEIYHILAGEGRAEIGGVAHRLRPGLSLFIPADAPHRALNTGTAPLTFLFTFPTDSFEDVVYHFDG